MVKFSSYNYLKKKNLLNTINVFDSIDYLKSFYFLQTQIKVGCVCVCFKKKIKKNNSGQSLKIICII